ncbi:phosphatidate cytidylyltransferase [Gemmatirosa kalamazoonensis]|uniref:Phosphatidate cytidylyltransferase n=1 Tax=Gemmatirosa kalamazoonensis TaxID=861299 RepID=W0RIL5_9BACT|nr:phosphatidate cytidylyltransferase [Gemmatirosa kalamazoonensis]AHG90944.1 phosphatidate cytidylyltransferase [Gemmatirosa kalamazoonensis]
MSELARRIAFAVVAAPLAIAVVWFGDAALATLLGIVAALGAWEFYRIAAAGGTQPLAGAGIVAAAILPLLVHAHYRAVFTTPTVVGVLFALGVLAAAIWRRGVTGKPLGATAATVFGVLYVAVPLCYGYALRYHDYAVGRAAGTAVIMLPVLLTWASDIGAYAVGRMIGRRKLIPSVSPGKTVEGALGALVATVLVALLYERFVLRPYAQLAMAPWWAAAFGLVISVAAQIGDLAESLLKREAGVKDSSHLLPGHGGILDRFDSLFFVLPVSYLLLGWLVLPAPGAGR